MPISVVENDTPDTFFERLTGFSSKWCACSGSSASLRLICCSFRRSSFCCLERKMCIRDSCTVCSKLFFYNSTGCVKRQSEKKKCCKCTCYSSQRSACRPVGRSEKLISLDVYKRPALYRNDFCLFIDCFFNSRMIKISVFQKLYLAVSHSIFCKRTF